MDSSGDSSVLLVDFSIDINRNCSQNSSVLLVDFDDSRASSILLVDFTPEKKTPDPSIHLTPSPSSIGQLMSKFYSYNNIIVARLIIYQNLCVLIRMIFCLVASTPVKSQPQKSVDFSFTTPGR